MSMDIYTLNCKYDEVNRVDGYPIIKSSKQYDFNGRGWIYVVRKIIIEVWDNDLLDKIINETLKKDIVFVRNFCFEVMRDYDIESWNVIGGYLVLYLSKDYPYYYIYFNKIRFFGYIIKPRICIKWIKLTKNLDCSKKKKMKRLLAQLCL